MKIFYYDVENGVYQGAAHVDAAMLQHESGITTLAPPVCRRGEVPVFDRCNGAWVVMSIAEVRQRPGATSD